MKKLPTVVLVACMVGLLVTSAPTASACKDSGRERGVLVASVDMAYSPDWGYWRGTATGDIQGRIAFYEQPQNFVVGDNEYFFERFTLTTYEGVIKGADEGVYNLATGDFWAHGWVTQASGHWAYLAGYVLFEWGTTTTPLVFPMIANGMPLVLLPNHPTAAHDDKALVSYTDMAYSPDWGYWRGTIKGDIRGTAGFWEQPENYVVADREYFFEAFIVKTHSGVIQGIDLGVYNLTTGDFWAYGQVTGASGHWGSSIGHSVFEWGTTSKPLVFPMTWHHVPFVLLEV